MLIRRLETKDIKRVTELWYEASVIAHHFIPDDYWKNSREAMATSYLPDSEVYVAVENDKITGFVAMQGNYLAAIFVDHRMQGRGTGKKLLNFMKNKRSFIQLKVYKKNLKSMAFYKSQKFISISEDIERETGECEVLLEWQEKKEKGQGHFPREQVS